MKNKNKIRIEKLPIFGILLTFGISKSHSSWELDMVGYSKNTPKPQFIAAVHSPIKFILTHPWHIVKNLKMIIEKVGNYEKSQRSRLNKELIDKAIKLHL